MKSIARQFLSAVLSAAIGLAPLAHADSSAHKLTLNNVIQSESVEYLRYLDQKKYGASSAELAAKVRNAKMLNAAKGAGHAIMSDVFQMSLIMAAAAVAELYKQRHKNELLLNGYKPKFEDVQAGTIQAAQDLICGSDPKNTTITSEIGCSGEYWTGVAGGFVLRSGMAGVTALLKLFSKGAKTQTALVRTVGTFATSFVMIAGFTASGQLWTQAVHVLGDKQKEERAHNLFGRAVVEMAKGNWSNYVKTEDGQLAAQVWENMRGILLYDANLRSAWIYNAWRFGLARGEIILNLGILMAALEVGGALGAGAGASVTSALGLSGLSATAASASVAFLVASAFGAGISAAVVYAPDWGVGPKITTMIQNTRAFVSQTQHTLTQIHLLAASDALDVNRFDTPLGQRYRKIYEKRARTLFTQLRGERVDIMNVYLEKYYELREAVEKSEATLAMAKEVIQNTELRKNLIVKGDNEYMSYDEAWAANCKVPSRDYSCNVPAAYQLRVIDESKKIIADARHLMEEIAEQMISIYDKDSNFLQSLLDKTNLQFPADVAMAMKDEADNMGMIAEKLIFFMGALHPRIAAAHALRFESDAERTTTRSKAINFVAAHYVPGMDEDQFLGPFKLVNGQRQ
jgi:hypothetical protein